MTPQESMQLQGEALSARVNDTQIDAAVGQRGLRKLVAAGTAALVSITGAIGSLTPEHANASETPDIEASSYHPIDPQRVEDTRSKGEQKLSAGEWRAIKIAGDIIPEEATAVVLNVTATGTTGAGFVSVVPTGPESTGIPKTSALNPERPDQSLANMTITEVGEQGQVSVYSDKPTHLIVDVVGYFQQEDDPAQVSGGRLVARPNARFMDTRSGAAMTDGATREVDLSSYCPDASAAVINLTGAEASGIGYAVAWAEGAMPATSSLNFDETGPRANTAFVPLSDEGTFMLHTVVEAANDKTSGVVEMIGDVSACFSEAGAPIPANIVDGLYVPVWQERLLDTRGSIGKIAAGKSRWVEVRSMPPGMEEMTIQAVSLNLTLNEAERAGFTTLDNRGDNDLTSAANAVHGQTVANAAIVPTAVTAEGNFGIYARNGGEAGFRSHLLVDIAGIFLGGNPPETIPPRDLKGMPSGEVNPPAEYIYVDGRSFMVKRLIRHADGTCYLVTTKSTPDPNISFGIAFHPAIAETESAYGINSNDPCPV